MNTVLQTKLYIPPTHSGIVPRSRLIDKLNSSLNGNLTLVSAPAGFGKTTVIVDWLSQLERSTAWVSLDEEDSNPRQFFSYIATALRPYLNSPSTLATLLDSPQPPEAKTWAMALVNDLTTLSAPTLLILDDYHVIESLDIDTALVFLLDHLPPQLHIAITTREDPPFPLPRYRVRGQLTELRAADLRFTTEETAVFLNQMMGLTLTPEDIATLETRTEGWIAGLQLAALSMKDRTDTAVFIKAFSGSHHFILDYLITEVLQRQPEAVHRFLLQTAILDQLNSSLCNAVTEQTDGLAMLATLEQDNLFVIRLDDERRWYRYHHLFTEVLRTRLGQEQPELVPLLHQRASDWYAENGRFADAIRHAFAANDFDRAAHQIELVWPTMDGVFQSVAWLAWARELPAEIIRPRPVLNVAYAWALLNVGDLEPAEIRLQEAEQCLNASADLTQMVIADKEQLKTLPASIASARTYHAQAIGDTANTMKYARQALDLLPEDAYIKRGPAASLLGLMQWANGELDSGFNSLADAMNGFKKANQFLFALSITYALADIRIAQGRLREALRIYEQSLKLAIEKGDPIIQGTTDIYWGLAMLHRERGDEAEAQAHLQKAFELGEQSALPDWPYRRALAQARIQEGAGAYDAALTFLDEAERLSVRTPVPTVRTIPALRAHVWLKQGRLNEAHEWADANDLSVDDEIRFLNEFNYLTLARLLIADYRNEREDHVIDKAIHLLARLLQAAEDGGRMGSVIEIHLLQALAHEAQHNIPLALDSLTHALTLARPERYGRLFVDQGAAMSRLLYDALANGIEPKYVRQLLGTFPTVNAEPTQLPTPPEPELETGLFETLSEREIEVLQVIAKGLTNQQVANQLYLSLHTVKVHARNIYGKLDVKNRTQAVAKARALGIIPPI